MGAQQLENGGPLTRVVRVSTEYAFIAPMSRTQNYSKGILNVSGDLLLTLEKLLSAFELYGHAFFIFGSLQVISRPCIY